ncbi:CheY-like chemotaxis protein [Deinobacterium chartae]|uniref:CheY-like chemotaxis protein n=1 Tax=Deinobacterium chartae TaxID=521158 RepID=A0A841I3P2_9DEIO|nr:response regulator [Deinobacterium chartae]MBB6098535.1 CheY-like chemotaxis protein [Deinobacterium chartae]
MDAKRILLVDDNEHDIELALAAFEGADMANSVAIARDGEEALAYLRREGMFASRSSADPLVVLMDLKMPKLSGLEVLRIMRQDARFRHLPVVMLTSSREQMDLNQCYACGANAYVVKPVDFAAFLQVVQTLGVFWTLLNEFPHLEQAVSSGQG